MITERAMTNSDKENMYAVCGAITTEKEIEIIYEQAKEKWCPSVGSKCLGHECAFFVLDRPWTDKRYIEARCTHAGKRPLSFMYGETTDYWKEAEEEL